MASPSKPPPGSSQRDKDLPETLKNLPLLGLRLNKDDSFKNQVQTALTQKFNSSQANLHEKEKLKAANIPATLIKIGLWQFAPVHEADLVGKFYFATRKLVWEVHTNSVKYKMEIPWSDVSAIRATFEENKPGILEIELRRPPTFYKETDPQPRCHALWLSADDFTDGQALICRRHYLEFPLAALARNYIKLLSMDCRLLELSQRGFPSSAEPTFCMLQHPGFENSQTIQVYNNISRSQAIPPLGPAAAADSALFLREHINSTYVREAGVPALQLPAITRQLVLALSQKSKPFHSPAQVGNPQANLHVREKLKATHIPAMLIKIGSWQFASVHETDLVGKFYFATRKFVWEVLVNSVKYKMEMPWSDVSAIRATIEENKPEILEIELNKPPAFYKETDPQPRRRTIWFSADDFTGGQALTCRRHYLEFPSAALNKNYINLLSSDRRLLELSQSSFPSSTETTFCTLQQPGLKNLQMTQVSNFSKFEALPPVHPAAATDSALSLRQDLNLPPVGEAGITTLQTPAIIRKRQGQLVLDPDPISRCRQRLLAAINRTSTSLTGSSSAVGSTRNVDAMGVQQERDGHDNSSDTTPIGPSEQNETRTSPIGLSGAGSSASNSDTTLGKTGT